MPARSFWRASLLTLAALGGFPPPGTAQDSAAAGIGSRIRLTFRELAPKAVGRLVELGKDSLTLEGQTAKDRRVLLRSSLAQVEVSVGQQAQIGRGIGLGALGGTLAGAVTAFVVSAVLPACDDPGTGDFEWCNKMSAGNVLGVIALGAAAGAAFGYKQAVDHPRDVWAPARWIDEPRTAQGSFKAEPRIGLGRVSDRRVLLLGLSLTR